MKKKVTLEQLARMTQGGFEDLDKKLDSFREEASDRFDGVDRRLDGVETEIKDVKTILGPLVRTVASMEFDIRELQTRVNKLERKISSVK
ncbi:hypothetical protein HY504_00155 [Candidatus Wolfebacteria bacterium]|nr:hypothetical protein [Candidatus Wolfebacteria bacterium]